jgi:hypothetical protein
MHYSLSKVALLACLLAGCADASEPAPNGSESAQPFGPRAAGMNAPGAPARPNANAVVIEGYGRAAGMPIGTGTIDAPDEEEEEGVPAAEPQAPAMTPDGVDIPMFETPAAPIVPCTGCVELSAIVDDINQRSQFTFDTGGVQATRVVWTILLPFNSDQLFIRSIVNGGDGPYTFMSANVFSQLNTPIEFVHTFNGTANTVGIALGSAGAWTGDQRVSVFVDSVTFEGANVTRTFDTDTAGFAAQGTERQPLVQLH